MKREINFKETHIPNFGKFETELSKIHACIGMQLIGDEAEFLVYQLKDIKNELMEISAQYSYDAGIVKKCKKLINTSTYLTAYFTVFVDNDRPKDIIDDEDKKDLLS